ncbi:hypothetical protein KOI35_28195 [Actinoplanes bogorensis]|uniref:Uncharacterized protein n=1 Tax=Paractinoplanes bogorensis TaxID=1610840 RepID=A0ABS5YXF8_9ACTN|nr:hypothetical protein [Actinoplanes bogorensis]MBU2667399.1 hypothetical protein [Actinoplanes bogorensis]
MPRSVEEILQHADELARKFEEAEPADSDGPRAEALAAIHRAYLSYTQALAVLAEAIRAARIIGVSWKAIGTLVGTSGEAARQRYGGGGQPFQALPRQRGRGDVAESSNHETKAGQPSQK